MHVVEINAPGDPPLVLSLRPLTGADERAVSGHGAGAALALLERLAVGLDVTRISVSQSDRALAALYQMLYGPHAECRVGCGACAATYEFTLDLPQIIARQDADRPGPPDADGAWTLPGGARVRAPTQADLTVDPVSLAARLTLGGTVAAAEVETFLETAAPVLALDLAANCPECGTATTVRFDLAVYLARRLVSERPFLLRETHLIAARYGWSLAEIMDLSREDRRAFAGLIEAERARLSRRQTA